MDFVKNVFDMTCAMGFDWKGLLENFIGRFYWKILLEGFIGKFYWIILLEGFIGKF
jgi:hypothetical protein